MKRGEVWMIDFGQPSGPEQAGIRPGLVLQEDSLTPAISTVIVVPMTTNLARMQFATSVRVHAGEAGLSKDSVVLCHQVQARGKARFLTRLGALPASTLAEVEQHILDAIGL